MFIEGQEDGPTKRVIGVVSAVLLVWSAMAVAFAQAAQQRVDGRINIEGWTVVGEVGLSPAASVDGISEYTVVWEIRDEHGNPVTDLSNLTCTYTYTGM